MLRKPNGQQEWYQYKKMCSRNGIQDLASRCGQAKKKFGKNMQ